MRGGRSVHLELLHLLSGMLLLLVLFVELLWLGFLLLL
jgi:hypothetical protein